MRLPKWPGGTAEVGKCMARSRLLVLQTGSVDQNQGWSWARTRVSRLLVSEPRTCPCHLHNPPLIILRAPSTWSGVCSTNSEPLIAFIQGWKNTSTSWLLVMVATLELYQHETWEGCHGFLIYGISKCWEKWRINQIHSNQISFFFIDLLYPRGVLS